MRVLIAHFRPDIVSGAELAIADMVEKRAAGFDYVMLAPGNGKLADYYGQRGFPVWSRRIETRRRLYPGLHTLQSFYFARKLRRERVDAVVCNTFPAAARLGTSCSLARVPHCIYVREFIRDIPRHRRFLRRADLVLAVSRDVAGQLDRMSPGARLAVAYDHLDLESVRARLRQHQASGRRLLPFDGGCPVVGIVGRLTTYKQPDLFLRAIPVILASVPEARFVVVGAAVERERPYEQGLHRLAAELGIGQKVAFMGQRGDAVELISELAVCCLTSDREPFPRTLLEAQAVGCPTVASNTGGCPEMIENDVTGVLFPVAAPEAHQQLAREVVRVLREPDRAMRLAARAKERVEKTFGSLGPVRQFEEHLRTLEKRRVDRE